MPKWLLPEHIADVLPAEARRIEDLRRTLLDRYRSYGYELVIPPLLEYLDSLFTGTGHDLDLRTFKLVDQLSGKTMGVRADFTPQVARIDAHLLNRKGVVRLCYSGSVLHTLPRDMHATREPLQVGAELYGHPGIEADIEVAELALASAAAGGNRDVRIDLSHMGVLRALLGQAQLGADQAEALVALVRAKDVPSLREFAGIDDRVREALIVLCGLYGGPEVIDEARRALPRLPEIEAALDALARLVSVLPSAQVGVDLGELHGYAYHSGIMFAVYGERATGALVRGGRYDQVGGAFGRARPATGFSLDLRELAFASPDQPIAPAIRAPWGLEANLREAITALRAQGEIVVQSLPERPDAPDEYACDRELRLSGGVWKVFRIE